MALTTCHECGGNVSTEATACPLCGAKPQPPVTRRRIGTGTGLLVIAAVFVAIVWPPGGTNPPSPAPDRHDERPQTNFDLPLETSAGTLVCPPKAALDVREGHGVVAAMKSRNEIFGRQEDAEKAGCEEWRQGIPITLEQEAVARAKDLQGRNYCAMLPFASGYVYSCALRNVVSAAPLTHLQWDKPATVRGTLQRGQFDNCCEQGRSQRQAYSFVRLDNPASIQSNGPDQPGLDRVAEIQLGGGIQGVDAGSHIVVACAQIWSGNTGHYALPVYCTEPRLQ